MHNSSLLREAEKQQWLGSFATPQCRSNEGRSEWYSRVLVVMQSIIPRDDGARMEQGSEQLLSLDKTPRILLITCILNRILLQLLPYKLLTRYHGTISSKATESVPHKRPEAFTLNSTDPGQNQNSRKVCKRF